MNVSVSSIRWLIAGALVLAVIIGSREVGIKHARRQSQIEISQLKEKVAELERKKDVRGNSGFSRDQCATARNVCGFGGSRSRRRSSPSPALRQ